MGGIVGKLLPHSGGSQASDPFNVHSWAGGKLDPEGLFKAPAAPSPASILAESQAQTLLGQAQSGKLTAGQEAQVKEAQQSETAQGEQLMASAGLGRSSSEVAVRNQALQLGTQMTNDFINQDYQEALSLMGVSNQGLVDAANLAIQQDEQMGQAFGAAASSFATLYGQYATRGGGTKLPDINESASGSFTDANGNVITNTATMTGNIG